MIKKIGLGLEWIPSFGPYLGFIEKDGEVQYVHTSDVDARQVVVACKPGRSRASHVHHVHTVEVINGAIVGKTMRDGEAILECTIPSDHPAFEAAMLIITAPAQHPPMSRL